MQQIDTTLQNALEHGYDIKGTHQVIAEWSYNDIFNTQVSNRYDPDESIWIYSKSYFPASSITSGFRPDNGIHYGLVNQAFTSRNNQVTADRYYVASPIATDVTPVAPGDDISNKTNATGFSPVVDKYLYWASPFKSEGSTNEQDPGSYGINNCSLTVSYVSDPPSTVDDTEPVPALDPRYTKTNKIKIGFNFGAAPVDWQVEVKYFGDVDFTVISDDPIVDPVTGACYLWWDGFSWSQIQTLDENIYLDISDVRVTIFTCDTPLERIFINEISARREIDVTKRTIDWQISYEMSEQDYIHPAGTISASTGTITLNNYDQQIKETDTNASFYGLLAGWSEYRVYIDYDLTEYHGTEYHNKVRVATMYTNDFEQQDQYEYQIQLFDILKRLQTINAPVMFQQNITIGALLSRLLDMSGIDKYDFTTPGFASGAVIEYFWSDGTQTLFDVLDGVCQSHQSAIFADESGIIKLLTRDQIANATDTPVWTFLGLASGGRLADVISLNKKYTLQANDVLIQYDEKIIKDADTSSVITQSGIDSEDLTKTPLTTQVFQTSDAIVLRAAPLTRDLLASSESLSMTYPDNWNPFIEPDLAANWPFAGKYLIGTEYCSYNGKGYVQWLYDSGTNTWSAAEHAITSVDEQLALDQATYASYQQNLGTDFEVVGGLSSNPSQQNSYSGRLITEKRDLTGVGEKHYSVNPQDGWFGLNGWEFGIVPGKSKYFEYGNTNTLANVQDWRNKPGWCGAQSKWTWHDSLLSCDNIADANWSAQNKNFLEAIYLKDLGGTDYREFGTRFKFTSGEGVMGIIFYLSDASGYADTAIADPTTATRCYLVNVSASALVHAVNATDNEVIVQVKNGASCTSLKPTNDPNGLAGKQEIDLGVWYDLDVAFNESFDTQGNVTGTHIDVSINGLFIASWFTEDVIKPTQWAGVYTKHATTTDYEYFYANSTTASNASDESFTALTIQAPSGTSQTIGINIPTDSGYCGRGIISFATTDVDATISNVEVIVGPSPGGTGVVHNGTFTNLTPLIANGAGPFTIPADSRVWFYLDDLISYGDLVQIDYTSTNDLSICLEYSLRGELEYGVFDSITPNNSSFDSLTGQYQTNKINDLLLGQPQYSQYSPDLLENLPPFEVFFDDFGEIIHEVRDFDFYLDVSPAVGTGVFSSNDNVRIIDYKYNPMKGIFTMINCSHQNEIVNGTQQIDSNNSVDQTLFMYGYALVDNGQKTKEVKDNVSIRKRGVITATIDGSWVFNEDAATDLARWVIEHWSSPMDVLELEVFSHSNIQLGDKVNINFPNADVDEDWLFIVIKTDRSFDNNAFGVVLTLQRVR